MAGTGTAHLRDPSEVTLRAAQTGLDLQRALEEPLLSDVLRFSTRIGVSCGELILAWLGGVGGKWELVVSGNFFNCEPMYLALVDDVDDLAGPDGRDLYGQRPLTPQHADVDRNNDAVNGAGGDHGAVGPIRAAMGISAGNELPGQHDPPMRVLPANERFELADAAGFERDDRLVENAEFAALARPGVAGAVPGPRGAALQAVDPGPAPASGGPRGHPGAGARSHRCRHRQHGRPRRRI